MSEEIKGWKLVPVEPTVKMLEASHATNNPETLRHNTNIFKAMLAAAPEPTSVGMEPKYFCHKCEVYSATDGPWYSAEQLATESLNYAELQTFFLKKDLAILQAKLEQAEKDKAELVEMLKQLQESITGNQNYILYHAVNALLAKYEEKKS